MISHEWYHGESRDARSTWRFHTLRKMSQLFENLNDAYSVYVTVKGKTDINRKPFERQKHTDDERLSNG